MKVLQATAALAALVGGNAIATTADAAPFYASVSAGQTTNANVEGADLSDGFAYGAALGTSVGPLRVEAGVDHVSGSFASVVDVDAFDYSATAFLDLPITEKTGIFIGAGADYVDGGASIYGSSLDASGYGYHWEAGVAHRLADGIIGEVSYRSTSADLDTDYGSVDAEFAVVSAGIRFAL